MKLTKLTMYLFAVALLLVTVSAVRAADTESAPAPKLEAAQQAPVLGAPGESCDADSQPLVSVNGQEAVPMAFNTCGSCSTDGCAGALRYSLCWTGGPKGWGVCDIYSGSNLCSSGGLKCSCGSETEPIP